MFRSLLTLGTVLALLSTAGCTVSPPPAPQSTGDLPEPDPAAAEGHPDHHGDRLDRGRVQPAPDVRPVPGQRRDQRPGAAQLVPAGPGPSTSTGSRWEMDPTLLISADVTSNDPFTVTYKIRPEASWTDNAPIAADDFWYLWRQMVSQPGVVDPAGYDLITGVQSIDGGKTAVVTFSQPYPAWRELFNDLLPAHIVKDVPGGFPAGLVRALPVTGASSGSTTSTRSATRSCSPATTGSGECRPHRTRSCSAGPGRRPHWPTRSATATPGGPGARQGRRRSPSSRPSRTCAPTGSTPRGCCS